MHQAFRPTSKSFLDLVGSVAGRGFGGNVVHRLNSLEGIPYL